MQEKIGCLNGHKVSSLCFYFNIKKNETSGHVQNIGKKSIKSPSDCLSINEIIQGMKEFLHKMVSLYFMKHRIGCGNFFRTAISENHVSPQQRQPSVGGFYIMQILFTMFNKELPLFGFIHEIMHRLIEKPIPRGQCMNGPYTKSFAKSFFVLMRDSFFKKIIQMFLRDPIHLRDAIDKIKELIQSCSCIIKFKSHGLPNTINDCVSAMLEQNKLRLESLDQVRKKRFEGYVYQEKEEQNKQKKIAIEGIASGGIAIEGIASGGIASGGIASGGIASKKLKKEE